MKFSRLFLAIAVPVAGLWLFLATLQIKASPNATFTVNSTVDAVDVNPGDGVCETAVAGQCTLRAAVMEANALSGKDSILLPSGTFSFSIAGSNENAALSGDLDILEDLSITGNGVTTTKIDGNRLDRVFQNFSGVVLSLSNLTVQNGYIASPGTPGGGISNAGTLIIDNSAVFSNTTYTTPAHGGGIYSSGILTITESTVEKNLAQYSNGGGVYSTGQLYIANSTFNDNSIQLGVNFGGSLMSTGTADIQNSTFSENGQMINAGTMTIQSSTFYNEKVDGFSGSVMTITHTIIASDIACDGGGTFISGGYNLEESNHCGFNESGDLINTPSLLGPLADNGGATKTHAPLAGSKVIDGGSNILCPSTDQRGFTRPIDGNNDSSAICDIGAVEYNGETPPTITFAVNSTDDQSDVNPGDMVCETAVGNNKCTLRAAIQEGNQHLGFPISVLVPAGTYSLTTNLMVTNSLNIIGSDPNEVFIIQTDVGYVIRTDYPGLLPMSIANVTLESTSNMFGGVGDIIRHDAGTLEVFNTNVYYAKYGTMNDGVGIHNFDEMHIKSSAIAFNSRNIINYGNLTVENSTIYSSTFGGIIHNNGTLTVTNSTFSQSGIANLANNVAVVNNILDGCSGNPIVSLGNNIDSGTSCNLSNSGDLSNTNPLLGDFITTYGTASFDLLSNSPAIDAGSNESCLNTDQRKAVRPFDGNDNGTAICDIGSVEYGSQPIQYVYLPLAVKP
ncbi:MAG: CSLREA domain-containing protein [Ardenticatenaceae bacterium]|nr:CSLREA domain-containing protein [Ardenticatenaceae bacterium]